MSSTGKSNGKGKFEQKPRGVCWNCGEKGHFKDKCPKPAADKKNDSPKSKANVANAMIDFNSEGDGAFFMEPMSDDDGWFTEVTDDRIDSGWETKKLSGVNWSECGSLVNIDLDSDMPAEPEELAASVGVGTIDMPHTEIYDSGCSKHLMLYRDALENFVEISPKPL